MIKITEISKGEWGEGEEGGGREGGGEEDREGIRGGRKTYSGGETEVELELVRSGMGELEQVSSARNVSVIKEERKRGEKE